MKKRVLAVLLTLCMVLGLMPMTAFAADEKHDISKADLVLDETSCGNNCKSHIVTGTTNNTGIVWKQHNVVVKGGKHTITVDNANIITPTVSHSGIEISDGADVTLVLVGNNEIHGSLNHPAIWVESGCSLTIKGTGSLKAIAGDYTGSSGAAGIGGSWGDAVDKASNFGDITIESGNVVAEGSGGGAGIGGGYLTTDQAKKPAATGNITINGGFVKAYGGKPRTIAEANAGAGIGTGYNQDYKGTITINGGVVYAEGGSNRARSIGGTQFLLNGTETKDGTFTTGENGNAVIIANTIGDKSQQAKWDAVLVSGDADDKSVTLANNKVTLNDGNAKFDVVGNPVVDYDLEVAKGTTLNVSQYEVNGKYQNSNLTIAKDNKLVNNGVINLGVAVKGSKDASVLTLLGGKAQTSGKGILKQVDNAVVRLPLSKDLVNMEEVKELSYNGTKQEAKVDVKLVDLWGYDQDFTAPKEYTVAYADALSAGKTVVTVTSTGMGNLIGTDSVELGYEIAKADYNPGVTGNVNVAAGEKDILSKLPKTNITVNPSIKDDLSKLNAGTLTWYMDADHKKPVTSESLKNYKAGDKVTLYWAHSHKDANFVNNKAGETVVTITAADSNSKDDSKDNSSKNDKKSPKTGLEQSIGLWAAAMLVSGVAVTGLASKKRKFNK